MVVGLEALNRFECYLVNTMDALCAHLDEIDHPNIRAMYDTFHANIEEADPIGALTRNKDHVVHIHISENDRGVPGRGNIPWAETYAAIKETGYDGWLTIESFGRGSAGSGGGDEGLARFRRKPRGGLSRRLSAYPRLHVGGGSGVIHEIQGG